MSVHSDYEDLFRILNTHRIKYLVVGAYAVIYYTQPRYTKDIDIWILPDMNKVERIYGALKEFGAPLRGVKPEDFSNKQMILQIGIAPVRVDIMLSVPGLLFKEAWKNKKKVNYGKTSIHILGKKDLIKAKMTANRPEDKIDIAKLKKTSS